MKQFAVVIIVLAAGLIGCSQHYYQRQENKLQFYLINSDAKEVLFASSTDGYQPHPTTRLNSKTWKISIPGSSEFTYFYIVDGKVFLPPCPLSEKDDFGSQNCLFVQGM